MSKIEWDFCDEKVSREVIENVAGNWGIVFTDEFIQCAMLNHGGYASKEEFKVDNTVKTFGNLLSFEEESDDNIVKLYNGISERLPKDIFPFAIDPSGNYICFDYRKSRTESCVIFWEHEGAYLKSDFPDKIWKDGEFEELVEKSIHRIANSFEDFLNKLY